MQPDVVVIAHTAIDFNLFVGLAREILGFNLASAVDGSPKRLSDGERFLSCLAAMRNPEAAVGMQPCLLSHVALSVFLAADEPDLAAILECVSGMSFVTAETVKRGCRCAVISGTLAQWRDAIRSGSTPAADQMVRVCFNKIYQQFCGAGLNIWTDCNVRQAPDNTLLLEDKRR
jgi:hypothetical protein